MAIAGRGTPSRPWIPVCQHSRQRAFCILKVWDGILSIPDLQEIRQFNVLTKVLAWVGYGRSGLFCRIGFSSMLLPPPASEGLPVTNDAATATSLLGSLLPYRAADGEKRPSPKRSSARGLAGDPTPVGPWISKTKQAPRGGHQRQVCSCPEGGESRDTTWAWSALTRQRESVTL
jgi:hypothetical protein